MMGDKRYNVGCLTVQNIRGIFGKHEFDLDADVVIITGPNGFGKTSLLDAICLGLTGGIVTRRGDESGTGDAVISYGRNEGSIRIESRTVDEGGDAARVLMVRVSKAKRGQWESKPLGGDLTPDLHPDDVARVTRYSQDILDQVLGDEGETVSLVRKLLQPPPELLRKALDAIRENRERVKRRLGNWSLPDVESEEAIEVSRKEAIQEFRDAWWCLSEAMVEFPGLGRDAFLSLRGGNLRKNWEGELRLLVEKTIGRSGLAATVDKKDRASRLLRILEDSLEHLRTARQVKEGTGETRPGPSVLEGLERVDPEMEVWCVENQGEIPSGSRVLVLPLSEAVVDAVSRRLEGLRQDRKDLLKRRGELRKILEGSGPEGGVEQLSEWMERGKERSEAWATLVRTPLPAPPGRVPRSVAQWLEETVSSMRPALADLGTWLEEAREAEESLKEELFGIERYVNQQERLLELWRWIAGSGPDRAALRGRLETESRLSIGSLRAILEEFEGRGSSGKSDEVEDAFQRLLEATRKWRAVEERAEKRRDALEREYEYRKMRERVEEVEKALSAQQGARGVLWSVQDVPDVRSRFVRTVNDLLGRFRLVPGVTPIEVTVDGRTKEARWKMRLKGGRGIGSLSTGQKALLGIATMVALNLALSRVLNHRVLLFDDITTALDMAQLPRMAVLIRQLAYARAGNEELRRQVILSSHHEEMTHRLLDYLLPPPGRKLKVVNFTGWDNQRGPTYEIFVGRERAKSLDEVERRAKYRLQELWGGG